MTWTLEARQIRKCIRSMPGGHNAPILLPFEAEEILLMREPIGLKIGIVTRYLCISFSTSVVELHFVPAHGGYCFPYSK